MNQTKARDLKLGSDSEQIMLPHIRSMFLDASLELSTDKYSAFDYYNPDKTVCIELKTRLCNASTYPTTMIPMSKIQWCKKSSSRYWFVFRFKDCVKYIKYNKELFDTFEKKIGGRNDRGFSEYNDYIYIPLPKCQTYDVVV